MTKLCVWDSIEFVMISVSSCKRCIARDANVERQFFWHEVRVKRSASFEVVDDSGEDCTRSKWIFTIQ
jgi:hypothetical protein